MPSAILNGFNHHWEEYGSGDPLVMLHGAATTGSSRALATHAHELGKSFRVVTPDLRGLGRSARVESLPPSAWVDDLRALMDHLDIPATALYGLSVGSRVALRFAIDDPVRVRCLMVDAPILYNEPDAQAAVAGQFKVETVPLKRQQELRELHGDDWETAVANYDRIRAQPDLQQYFDLRALVERISAPLLIIRGDARGGGYSAEHAFMLYRQVRQSSLWIQPQSAGAIINAAPAQAYAVIRSFIAKANSSTIPSA